jgi:hypothetical protein
LYRAPTARAVAIARLEEVARTLWARQVLTGNFVSIYRDRRDRGAFPGFSFSCAVECQANYCFEVDSRDRVFWAEVRGALFRSRSGGPLEIMSLRCHNAVPTARARPAKLNLWLMALEPLLEAETFDFAEKKTGPLFVSSARKPYQPDGLFELHLSL